MANPDVGDVHVDSILTQVSIGYKPAGFFALRAFPQVPVDKQTDIYIKYDKSPFARDLGAPGAAPTGAYAAMRAPGTIARKAEFKVDKTNVYSAANYALGFEIPDELRANADSVFKLDNDATTLLTSLLNLRFDRKFVADFVASSVWDNTLTVGNKWDDYSASTPIEDVRGELTKIRRGTLGMSAEGGVKVLMGALVEQRLLDHPDLVDRIKYTGGSGNPARVSRQAMAQLLNVDEVIVAESVYTADEESATAEASLSYSDVLSDAVLIYWTPPGAQLMAPSAGYMFNWRAAAAGGAGATFVRKGRNDRARYDWVEVHSYLDWVATASGAGSYGSDVCD